MQELIRYWKVHYYSELLLCLVLCITFIISLRNRKYFAAMKYIPLYTITLFLTSVSAALYKISHINNYLRLAHYLDYFFTFLELITFSHFYYSLISNRIVKKSNHSGKQLFFIFFCLYAITR